MNSSGQEKEVLGNQLLRGRWFIDPPNEESNKDGNIVLIKELSFGPLEIFEYGFTNDGKPYRSYEWVENDFYADDSYFEEIPLTELLKKLKDIIDDISDTELSNWKVIYEKVVKRFYEDVEFPWSNNK